MYVRRNAEKYGINSYRVYKWSYEHLLNITFKIKLYFFGKFYILYKNIIQKHYYTIIVQLVNS